MIRETGGIVNRAPCPRPTPGPAEKKFEGRAAVHHSMPMNVLRSGWCVLFMCGIGLGHAAEQGPTDVVRSVVSKLGLPAGTMPLAIRLTESEGSRKWELLFEDRNFKGNRRLVEFQGDTIVDDRAEAMAGTSGPLSPLVAADLVDKTGEVRARAEKLAAMAEMDCHRIRALLLRPTPAASAHWEVEVAGKSGQVVGRMVFGCPQPRLIASSWGADPEIVGPTHRGIEALGMESVKALQELEDRLRRMLQGDGEKSQ